MQRPRVRRRIGTETSNKQAASETQETLSWSCLMSTCLQVHVKSESLAVKISQEINYAKSLYYEQQLMLPASDNEDGLLLES